MADWRATRTHWGIVTKLIHWLMAVMIIGLLAVGFIMTDMENSNPQKYELYQTHKSFGFTIMALALVRLVWRFTGEAPTLPAAMPGWQKLGAHFSHISLYGLMFLMPLSGWVMVSASTLGIPTKYFGLFTIPHIVDPDQALYLQVRDAHEMIAYALIAVIVLHVIAGLKHALIDRDGVFSRMLPGRV